MSQFDPLTPQGYCHSGANPYHPLIAPHFSISAAASTGPQGNALNAANFSLMMQQRQQQLAAAASSSNFGKPSQQAVNEFLRQQSLNALNTRNQQALSLAQSLAAGLGTNPGMKNAWAQHMGMIHSQLQSQSALGASNSGMNPLAYAYLMASASSQNQQQTQSQIQTSQANSSHLQAQIHKLSLQQQLHELIGMNSKLSAKKSDSLNAVNAEREGISVKLPESSQIKPNSPNVQVTSPNSVSQNGVKDFTRRTLEQEEVAWMQIKN